MIGVRLATTLAAVLVCAGQAAAVDDGFAWHVVDGVSGATRVFPSSIDPETAYVWTASGLVATRDGGDTFTALPAAPQLGEITALLVVPNRPATLYAGTAATGVFRSDDGGAGWNALGGADHGLAHARIRCLAFAAGDSSFTTIYATHSLAERGISMTIDGGRTWRVFAEDYGADDCIVLANAVFFAGRNAAQGDGFFRYDASRGWLCVLTEPPRALVASPLDPQRVWFGTEGAGLSVSDDFGITMRKPDPGPPEADAVSVAVGWSSAKDEVVYAYDPAGQGVMRSRDGFATWEKLDDGFAATAWAREGSSIAANAGGSMLYACRNGDLYRGAPARRGPMPTALRASPAAAVAGVDAVLFTCRAPAGAEVSIDLSPLANPAPTVVPPVPMHDDGKDGDLAAGDGVYSARVAKVAPPRSGQFALPVNVVKGGESAHGLALLTVMPNTVDAVLWNGENAGNDALWNGGGGGVSIARSSEHPLSGKTHLRLTVTGPGCAGWGWNGWGGGTDTSRHKMIGFYIRSDQPGPPRLKIELDDDGSGSGIQNGQKSHLVDLARYAPDVGPAWRFVSIPLADLTFGSKASPFGLRQMQLTVEDGAPRTYDFDDLTLIARPVPHLAGAAVRLGPDGKDVVLSVSGGGDAAPLKSVVARIPRGDGSEDVPLFDDGRHGDGASGDGSFAATLPVEHIGRGTRDIIFTARDDDGEAVVKVSAFIPARSASVPRIDGGFSADGDFKEFAGATPLATAVSAQGLSLEARLLHGEHKLYVGFEAVDPTFADGSAKDAKDATAAKPAETVWVEDALPPGAAPTADGGDAWTWAADPKPFSGAAASVSNAAGGPHQHYFANANPGLPIAAGERLLAYVWLDPANPPTEVMMQFNDGSWEHRAYWGADQLAWGAAGPSRFHAGELPKAGVWARLEVPASSLGLEGKTLTGVAFSLFGGRAAWDHVGKVGAAPTSSAAIIMIVGAAAEPRPRAADEPVKPVQRVEFTLTDGGADGGAHAAIGAQILPCFGARTQRGWRIEAELPASLVGGDPALGAVSRLQLVLRGAAGGEVAWASAGGAASLPVMDPEGFGEVVYTDTVGPPHWRCVSAVGTVLTLQSSKPIDPTSAKNAASFHVDGLAITAVALAADGRLLRLTADRAWPLGAEQHMTFSGVRASDGAAAAGVFAFTPQPGLPVGDGYIREYLVGAVKQGIDPMKVDKPLIDENVHPARGGDWQYVSADGPVDLGSLIGGSNVGAHAHVYVHADADRVVQLWLGSDDGVRVSVNGVCVHTFAGARGITADQDKVPGVKLHAGWNDVLLLITQGGGGWGFVMRIRDDQGGVPQGLSYAADSPYP